MGDFSLSLSLFGQSLATIWDTLIKTRMFKAKSTIEHNNPTLLTNYPCQGLHEHHENMQPLLLQNDLPFSMLGGWTKLRH